MSVVEEYLAAQLLEGSARLRRQVALRAMAASGMTQRQIAEALGVTQPAVSQQLHASQRIRDIHPEELLAAAAPVLRRLAEDRGYRDLRVFGSVARREARADSDIDLLVTPPEGTSTFDFLRFHQLVESVLGRSVDLASEGGLRPGLDDDILREAVPL